MKVHKSRQNWALLAVFTLGCDGTSLPTRPVISHAHAAEAGAAATKPQDAGPGVSDPDAAPAAPKTQDAGSCDEQSSAASSGLQAALSGADQACATDADCKIAYLTTDCFHGCSAVVSTAAQQALDTAVAQQNQTTCAGFMARGCFYPVPPCVAPGVAACIAGQCTEFQGYPQSNTDGGASAAPLALDQATTAGTADLTVGQRLDLTLHSIGGGDYGEPQLSSTALRFAQTVSPRLQNPGGPTKVYVFQADRAGQVEITIPHSVRPEPFKLTVTIR